MNQTYINPSTSNDPVEIVYKFPKEPNTSVSRLQITLNDKTISAEVMANQKAKEKYEDAIAAGDAAAIMKESEDNFDLYELILGNIFPG